MSSPSVSIALGYGDLPFAMPKQLPLTLGREYIFIDAAYTDDFKRAPAARGTGLPALRSQLFPYTDDAYALFRADAPAFELTRIRRAEDANGAPAGLPHFCSDSGLVLVVDVEAWWAFLAAFDAEHFVFDYLENPATRFKWDAFMTQFSPHFQWFYTAEADEQFAGGGSFQIEAL